jgi:predicted membrane chloride channel (bestrophin family)
MMQLSHKYYRIMQTGRSSVHDVLRNKPKLFALISILVISALALPVILPHATHPTMIYHIIIISLILAVFLSCVSILAYNRNRNARMLLMMFGFSLLAVVELLYLFHSTANIRDIIVPIVDAEFSHLILLTMLALFGIGVLKVSK